MFLNEIDELALSLPPKMLRAMETKEVQPVGSSQSYQVDLRLMAATNRDLRAMVKARQFRGDLSYRLSAMAVEMPLLRARREAVEALATHFVAHYNRLFGNQVRLILRRRLAAGGGKGRLNHHPEVDHFRALQTTETAPVKQSDNPGVTERAAMLAAPDRPRRLLLDEVIRMASKAVLLRALHKTSGNCHRAAQLLGVSR
jgi:transcriptional regulator with PAS, ATPase and Fis domain